MKARWRALVLAIASCALVAACQGSGPEHQHAKLGSIGYDVPADWQRRDMGARETLWTPQDNARKESVAIVRADLDPALAKAGPTALQKLLLKAQGSLANAKVSAIDPIATSEGLQGFRVSVDFAPLGPTKPHYTRIHTLLVDGKTLVHVMYTAASPDPESQAMKMAVDTAHTEG